MSDDDKKESEAKSAQDADFIAKNLSDTRNPDVVKSDEKRHDKEQV